MCYHSIRNPCEQCGCPSNTVPKSAKLNPTGGGGRPSFTDQQAALSFFSPSSDYYSLSPDSPPPNSGAAAASSSSPEPDVPAQPGVANPGSPVAAPASSMPIYAQVHKERSVAESSPQPESQESAGERDSVSPASSADHTAKPATKVAKKGPPTARKPSAPPRYSSHEGKEQSPSDSGSRRHSWAGERKAGEGAGRLGGSRPTSLQEFKRLLAQQTPGPNPHRLSAQEMLKAAAAGSGGGIGESQASSHQQQKASGSGGSLRKKTSPWRDNRFSVIQEEGEQEESRRSRENLLD